MKNKIPKSLCALDRKIISVITQIHDSKKKGLTMTAGHTKLLKKIYDVRREIASIPLDILLKHEKEYNFIFKKMEAVDGLQSDLTKIRIWK